MSPKHHPTPLSGGDRKALKKELAASPFFERQMTRDAADLRARGEAMLREADRLDCEAWNERMWRDGEPIDPSPAIDEALNGGYGWLQVECSRCRAPRDVDLAALPRVATTRIHDLSSRLICARCKAQRRRPPATLKQLAKASR